MVFSLGDRSRISALRDSGPSPSPHESLQHCSTRLPSVAVPTSCSFFPLYVFPSLSESLSAPATHSSLSQHDSRVSSPSVFLSLSFLIPSTFHDSTSVSLSLSFSLSLSLSIVRGLLTSLLQATPYLKRSSVQNGQMALGSSSVGETYLSVDWCSITWYQLTDQSPNGLTSVH